MKQSDKNSPSRRDLLKTTGGLAAASVLASAAMPAHLYAAGGDTIQLALVGCGGRGSGAAPDAMRSKNGPVKLVAMADVFQDKLDRSYKSIEGEFAKSMDVPKDRQFIGFDAYQKAMDCLKPGDIVILATPPAFRWVHFTYAIKKGLNVFMEKPITVDGPSTRKMLELADEAAKKNLKVGVGLMCRHCDARNELFKRIKDGALGELTLLQAYRMHGPVGSAFTRPYKRTPVLLTELLYQIRNFHSFLWASGGCYSDFYVHNIDECCWMKDAWPVKAQATGGRHYRGDFVDQNFDTYAVEYTFADGTKLYLSGRTMDKCYPKFASYAYGTKGCAVISERGHSPTHARTYSGFNIEDKSKLSWEWGKPEPSPYQLEWDHLLAAIREDKAYNEVKRGAQASLVTAMGRMAAHTGQVVTYDYILKDGPELAPELDKLTMDSPAPLQADKNGKYPTPQPGKNIKTEF